MTAQVGAANEVPVAGNRPRSSQTVRLGTLGLPDRGRSDAPAPAWCITDTMSASRRTRELGIEC